MTREILEKYIASRGMKLYKSDAKSTQVFMAMMCMDTAYQIFSQEIAKHSDKYRHNQRKWFKHIKEKFLHFFNEFNRPFSEDDLDVINEDMDKFGAYVANEVMFMKIAIANICTDLELDKQMIVANMYMINILGACANVFWHDTFHSRSITRGDKNSDIEGVMAGAKNFVSYFLNNGDFIVSDAQREAVEKAKMALLRKMRDFTENGQRI